MVSKKENLLEEQSEDNLGEETISSSDSLELKSKLETVSEEHKIL